MTKFHEIIHRLSLLQGTIFNKKERPCQKEGRHEIGKHRNRLFQISQAVYIFPASLDPSQKKDRQQHMDQKRSHFPAIAAKDDRTSKEPVAVGQTIEARKEQILEQSKTE